MSGARFRHTHIEQQPTGAFQVQRTELLSGCIEPPVGEKKIESVWLNHW